MKDAKEFEEVKPIVITIVALVVWLRQPLWSVPSCVKKAEEFWKTMTP